MSNWHAISISTQHDSHRNRPQTTEDLESFFKILNISNIDAKSKFGFLLESLQYGAPPHGGIAFGLDRIVALLVGANSIRDVIAFPKTQRGQCLLTDAPSKVEDIQLNDLSLRVKQPPKND